jgi:hypothetical protein
VIDMPGKDGFMATSLTGVTVPLQAPVISATKIRAHHRRRIDPQTGRALEVLGHTIEYLTDEYVQEGGLFSAHDPRVEAIQLLMARNREVYYACPEVPPLSERVRAWLHIHWPFVHSAH